MSQAGGQKQTEVSTTVVDELATIPRGDFNQNMYRMVYQQARLNGLGRRAQIAGTASAAHETALRSIREHQPDFVPVMLS
jgi:hypothetical protein